MPIINKLLNTLNSLPNIIQILLAIIVFFYSIWMFLKITDRLSRRASTSERNLRFLYKDAKWRISTGNFDQFKTKERCLQIIEQYKHGIPKENKLKRIAATIFDIILMLIHAIMIFGTYILIRS